MSRRGFFTAGILAGIFCLASTGVAGEYSGVGARDKSGAPAGDYKIVDAAGGTMAEGKFSKGKMDGPWAFYDSKHNKIAEVTYEAGVRSGAYKTFCSYSHGPQSAGKLESEGNMSLGKVTGRFIAHSPEDGSLLCDVIFKGDDVVKVNAGAKEAGLELREADLKFITLLENLVLEAVR